MSDLARTYERMKDIGRAQQESLSFKHIGDFYTFTRSCFPEGHIVMGTSFLKLLITEYGIFDIKFKEGFSYLLPIIYLYGPEIVEHETILSWHPIIDSQGGTLINGIVHEELESKKSYKQPSYSGSFDVRVIKILDEESLIRIREKYENYIESMESVSKLLLEHNLPDQITLSYNVFFNRDVFKKSHNILDIKEAISEVVWRTLCKNLARMMESPKSRYLKFSKDDRITLPNDQNNIPTKEVDIDRVHNQMNVKECLKEYGTKNDLVTFEAIYLLNIMGYPTGTRAGPLFPHQMKKGEYLYRLMSPHYFKALQDYQFYLYKHNLRSATVENPKVGDRSEVRKNAIKKFTKVKKIRSQVKKSIDQSVKNLQSQHLVEETKSSFIVKKRPIYVGKENKQHYEIDLSSLLEIEIEIKQMYRLKQYINNKNQEWRFRK